MLASREWVYVDGIDYVGEGDDVGRGVFIVVFVKSKALWSQHHPDLLPLAHAAFGFEDIEPTVIDDALVVGCGADVALLARVGLLLLWCSRGRRVGGGLVGVGEVKVGDGAALAAGVVEGL